MEQRPTKTIILRKQLDEEKAREVFEDKKTDSFGGLLKRPNKDEIIITEITFHYEVILVVQIKYLANYFQKATHTITVDQNVKEVILEGKTFPIKDKSRLVKVITRGRGNNKIELELDEHIFVEQEEESAFGIRGMEIKFPYDAAEQKQEQNTQQILDSKVQVIEPGISIQDAVNKLKEKIKSEINHNIRDLHEELQIIKVNKVYIPVYEARLRGPDRKVAIMRLDSVLEKIF